MARTARPRLTGGQAAGRPLPRGVPSSARPTSSRVREAIFSILGHDLEGLSVLDAFGGSGLLSLEAWSRGGQVVCVERNGGAVRAIRANVDGLGASVQVVRADVLTWARGRAEPFDLVLVDPPYALDASPILAGLAPLVGDRLLLEGAASAPAPSVPSGLAMVRDRCYGDTVVRVYRRG